MTFQKIITRPHDENTDDEQFYSSKERLIKEQNAASQIKRFNLGLRGLNVLLFCFVVYSLNVEIRNNSVQPDLKIGLLLGEDINEEESVVHKGKKVYLADLKKRNIFENYRDEQNRRKLARKVSPKEASKTLDQLIRLNGIIYKRTPVVVVEDLEKKEVLFLKAGDTVQDAEIEEIMKEKVIFKYKNRSVEIEL